jgi:hypothetical protein
MEISIAGKFLHIYGIKIENSRNCSTSISLKNMEVNQIQWYALVIPATLMPVIEEAEAGGLQI